MIDTIKEHARRTPQAVEKGAIDPAVLEAMRKVPRHEFVPDEVRAYAYQDRPLPIGYGQTISQPFIVAMMTDLLNVKPGDKVLEIGTGSGYQAAVLSPLAERVYSIEIVPELGKRAGEVLDKLDFANVETKIADGYYGWPEEAPFASALKGSLIASAKLPTAVIAKSTAQLAKAATKRGSRRCCTSARTVPLAPKPSRAIEMIM
ncbi:MAG TPA: protein-L-isoaspartate O-methyltransferase [Chloroflexota bacterium]|nr:protein-L-isoaspartate O-methyltransferase [Chloroflexota bacterium]